MAGFRALVACLLTASSAVLAQVTIPATNGSIPAAGSNGCAEGYYPGSDTYLYTVPYTYDQVLSIVGNYSNLTWQGVAANGITTNNTAALKTNDWTPGTVRTYDIGGSHTIETLITYSSPRGGPFVEIHTLAPLSVPSFKVDMYAPYEAQEWTTTCDGKATSVNFTAHYCATNATTAKTVFNVFFLEAAITVPKFLGGNTFTTCAALQGAGDSPSISKNGSSSATGSTQTGAANATSTAPITQATTNAAATLASNGILGAGLAGLFAAFL